MRKNDEHGPNHIGETYFRMMEWVLTKWEACQILFDYICMNLRFAKTTFKIRPTGRRPSGKTRNILCACIAIDLATKFERYVSGKSMHGKKCLLLSSQLITVIIMLIMVTNKSMNNHHNSIRPL